MEDRKFKLAPVSELVCGVRIEKGILNVSLIADIYNQFKDEFPLQEEEYALPDELLPQELYGTGGNIIQEGKPTFVRYWFLDKGKNKLIQVQDGAIYCNWRKMPQAEGNYPKFRSVYDDFLRVFNFVQSRVKATVKVTGAEITYLNHIYADRLEMNFGRIDELINQTNLSGSFKDTTAYKMKLNIPAKELNGIYFLDVGTSRMRTTKENVIIWNNGIKTIEIGEGFNLDKWFTDAHDFINERFMEVTTESFKKKIGYNG